MGHAKHSSHIIPIVSKVETSIFITFYMTYVFFSLQIMRVYRRYPFKVISLLLNNKLIQL